MPRNDFLMFMLMKDWEDRTIEELMEAPATIFEGLTDHRLEALQRTLGVTTVRELATHPLVRWSQALHTLQEIEDIVSPASLIEQMDTAERERLCEVLHIESLADLASNRWVEWAQALEILSQLKQATPEQLPPA